MKSITPAVLTAVLCLTGASVIASPIQISLEASNVIYSDPVGETEADQLAAGAYYQVWWSADAAYLTDSYGGSLDPLQAQAQNTAGADLDPFATSGDYLLLSGPVPNAGYWFDSNTSGLLTDSMVNAIPPATISQGYVYIYVYDYDGVGPNTPEGGDYYVRSPIYGPNAEALLGPTDGINTVWQDASNPQSPIDVVDVAPAAGVHMDGTFFVTPEPGTMALFGLGMLTIAARRRRK